MVNRWLAMPGSTPGSGQMFNPKSIIMKTSVVQSEGTAMVTLENETGKLEVQISEIPSLVKRLMRKHTTISDAISRGCCKLLVDPEEVGYPAMYRVLLQNSADYMNLVDCPEPVEVWEGANNMTIEEALSIINEEIEACGYSIDEAKAFVEA